MLEDDQPVAANLAIAVGDANRQIERLTFRIRAPDALDAVTEGEIAFSGDGEIRDVELQWTFEDRQEVNPILAICIGSEILPWGHDVENDQALVGHVALHDRVDVPGADRRRKPVLERPD
jgi:hypothetical protein